MNRRRELLIAIGVGTLAGPLTCLAQQQRPYRIGILADSATTAGIEGFYEQLRELGYVEGKNVVYERRFHGPDTSRAFPLAQELVALMVDVMLAFASTQVEAARRATSEIPIVFATHNDPVGVGHVVSLARPGRNATGVTNMATDVEAKRLQLLKELLPRTTNIAVLFNRTTPSHTPSLKEIEQVGPKLGLKLHFIEASAPEQLALAFEVAAKAGSQGLLLLSSPMSISEHKRIVALAATHHLPVVYAQALYVDAGGLISYGPNRLDQFRMAANYVDRILRGAKPADLPVHQPTTFELVIHLRTAKALGLTVPQSVMLRAARVIQ